MADTIAELLAEVERLSSRDKRLCTSVGKLRGCGDPVIDAAMGEPDESFDHFIASLPEAHWSKYDLSAVRIGWHHGRLSMMRDQAGTIAGLLDEVKRLTSDRLALQEAGEHPAPCARHCESTAYEIEIRQLRARVEAAEARLRELAKAQPVAWINTDRESLTWDELAAILWQFDGETVQALIPRPEMPS